ncbi:uncharacterized protein LOC111343937 isoform X1 [Stylophora pistillata]|uniref:uncharacterized protein LOC111343937 isoform X1 n=1 Tax=Stylophora pistillata TaxID=50429 RepID=UPI000C044228|nr:uncharacterized protein LOC111343937 isoform X1 [Stylophora pistillata]XP_022806874.1 uncharacterized protein LOC111343937 isoform X1 [Stylophora pistillata]
MSLFKLVRSVCNCQKQGFFILLCLAATSLVFLFQNPNWGLESIISLRQRYDLAASDKKVKLDTYPANLLINGAQDMTEATVSLSKQRAIKLEERLRTLSDGDSFSARSDLTLNLPQSSSDSPDSHLCPYEGLVPREQLTFTPRNKSCVPYKRTDEDCNEAFKYFGEYNLTSEPLQCDSEASRPICTFLTEFRFSPHDKVLVTCWRDVCSQSSPILLGCSDPEFGTVDKEEAWVKFHSIGELEQELPKIVVQNSLHGFNFCLLKCKIDGRMVKQALIFPPILKHMIQNAPRSRKKINVNIILEDSVSRSHFYRSMPRSVQSLRDIYRDASFQATVLDFELVQSYAAFTLPNVQFLMAGKSLKGSRKILKRLNGIGILTEKFKRFGYQTLMHEDLCWYDQWGTFLSPEYKKRLKPFSDGLKSIYEEFKQSTDRYVDNKAMTLLSCEILKVFGISNPFGGKYTSNYCWDGRSLSEYLLFYVRRFISLVDRNPEVAPALVYTHLNTGHEPSGKRIRTDDTILSKFLEEMARSDNTLTILISDHGGKTSDYAIETLPGSLEVYSPMMFMIIPHKVTKRLGKDRMNALILNQKRLVTFADLHHTLNAIAALTDDGRTNDKDSGLLQPVPQTRTCADIKDISSEGMCRCKGWRKFLSPNSMEVIWLAEFALGQINNMIQMQYSQGIAGNESKRRNGFGRCAMFVGKSIERPRQELIGKDYITTLVLVVEPAYGVESKERFEVQLKHSSVREHNITFIKYTRLSFYSRYKGCVDKNVDLNLCACTPHPSSKHRGSNIEDLIRARHFVDFGMTSSTRSLVSKCLLVTLRHLKRLVVSKKQTRVMSIELANVCKNETLRVKIGGIHRVTRFSLALPISLVLKPRTIRFSLSVLNGWKYGLFKPVFVHSRYGHGSKRGKVT